VTKKNSYFFVCVKFGCDVRGRSGIVHHKKQEKYLKFEPECEGGDERFPVSSKFLTPKETCKKLNGYVHLVR
jgi:hypothetical protein